MKRILALFTLLVAILMVAGPQRVPQQIGFMAVAATPASNQLVTCSTLVANTGSGLTFAWNSSAQTCSNGNLIINRATFVSWIKNTGSCAGGGNSSTYIMTWNDMLNCKAAAYTQHSVAVASGSSSDEWGCTVNQIQQTESCAQTIAPNTATMATLSSSTVAPTTSSVQLSISVSGLAYTAGCGGSPSLTVLLYNSGGTNVASWSGITTGTWSTTWYTSGAVAGTYTWKATESDPATPLTCSQHDGLAGGSYQAAVSWTGGNASSYY